MILVALSLLFLQFGESQLTLKRHYTYSKSHNSLNKKLRKKNKNHELLIAIMTGNKRRLSKKRKMALKTLGLYHLLSPSALHFNSTSKLIPWKQIKRIIASLMAAFLFLFSYIPTLFRASLIKVKMIHHPYFNLLLILLLESALTGNFTLSQSLSFCFLCLCYHFRGLKLALAFLFTNIILSDLFAQDLSTLSFLANLMIVPLFTFLFPLLALYYFTQLSLLKFPYFIFQKILTFFCHKSLTFPLITVDWFMGLGLLTSLLFKKPQIAIVFLIFFSAPLNNSKLRYQPVIGKIKLPFKEEFIEKTSYQEQKIISWWSGGTRCEHQLIQGFWAIKCK